MKDSPELFELVKSLTGPEKRYFKLVSALQQGEKNHTRLFDILDKLPAYNEKSVKKELADTTILRQLPRVKNYLYNLILKSMNAYHANNSSSAELNELLNGIAFLINKSLHKQCVKLIMKAKKIAEESENYLKMLEIITLERRLEANNKERLNEIALEEERIWKLLDNIRDYKKLSDQIFLIASNQGKVRNEQMREQLEQIIKSSLLNAENKALTYESKLRYYHIHAIYHDLIGETIHSYTHQKKMIKLMELFPERIAESPNVYITALNNLMKSLLELRKYDELSSSLKKLRSVPAASLTTQVRIFSNSYIIELDMYLRMGKFEQGVALVNKIEEGLNKFEGKIIKQHVLNFYFNISIAYFGSGNFSKSLKWLNEALNSGIDTREDLQSFAKIFNLLIHYELGNDALLPYSMLSTYRFLHKRNRIYKYESLMIGFIKKHPNTLNPKELTSVFKQLKENLTALLNDPFEKSLFEYFDIISWLESKIGKRPFAEIVQEKSRRNG